jgi:hypothetical protein
MGDVARTRMAIRIAPDAVEKVAAVAAAPEFEGNAAAAMRRLLALGLQAWEQGHRLPETIRRAS